MPCRNPTAHHFLQTLVRRLLFVAFVLFNGICANAQDRFIAPTTNTIIGSSEQGMGTDQAHILFVTNASSVPIIVFGITLSACENVKQWCAGQRTNVKIDAGARRNIGRVEPKSTERSFSYRWTFSYHPDSSDAKMLAMLRANGLTVEPTTPNVLSGPPTRVVMRRQFDTTAPPDIPKPLSREPLTDEERGRSRAVEERDPSEGRAFRFKVAYGSILASTMTPTVLATGPCVNPADAAAYEKDVKIVRAPWRPPVYQVGFGLMSRPDALKDSTLASKDVLVRFVADTTGDTIAESVSVLESSSATLSVAACKAAIAGRGTPAKDKTGHSVRAWVQLPIRVR